MTGKAVREFHTRELKETKKQPDNRCCWQCLSVNQFRCLFVCFQYSLLRDVTGRYIVPVSGAGPFACFYAGLLLDVFLALLRALRQGGPTTDSYIFKFHLIEDQRYDIRCLCQLSNSFRCHFKRMTGTTLISSCAASGSKIVD
jgi:hypothetical protein